MSVRARHIVLVLAGAFATVLTGCSGSQLESAVCGGPPPASLNPVVPQSLFPVPGYAKVPDATSYIVVAYNVSSGPLKQLVITPQGGNMIFLGGLQSPPNPLPAPIAAEQQPGASMWSVKLPTLKAHTTYAVGYHFSDSYCGRSESFTTAMGTFTTL